MLAGSLKRGPVTEGDGQPSTKRQRGVSDFFTRTQGSALFADGIKRIVYNSRVILSECGRPPSEVLMRRPRTCTTHGHYWTKRIRSMATTVAREISESEGSSMPETSVQRVRREHLQRIERRQESEGDIRLAKFFHYINSFGVAPTKQQRVFIWAAVQSILPQIYGDEWDTSAARVTKMFGISEINSFTLAIAMRRMGKTWAMAMIIAAYALTMPGKKVAIFAAVARSANWVIDKSLMFMRRVESENIDRRVCGRSANQLYISKEPLPPNRSYKSSQAEHYRTQSTTNRITAYPANLEGVRGFDGDLIIMEEAAWVPMEVFNKGIAPVLGIRHSALFGISTPESSNALRSYFMRALDKEFEGKPLYLVIRIALACNTCVEEGRADQCPHRVSMAPPWKGRTRARLIKAMVDSEEDYNQETLGLTNAHDDYVWPAWWIDNILRKPPKALGHAHVVYFGVDPACGGSHSDYTIVSFVRFRQEVVVSSSTASNADESGVVVHAQVNSTLRRPGYEATECGFAFHGGDVCAYNWEYDRHPHGGDSVFVPRIHVRCILLVQLSEKPVHDGWIIHNEEQQCGVDLRWGCVAIRDCLFYPIRDLGHFSVHTTAHRSHLLKRLRKPHPKLLHIKRAKKLTQTALADHWC